MGISYRFKEGDRVRVTSCCQTYNMIGTVFDIMSKSCTGNEYVKVKLDCGWIRTYNVLSLSHIGHVEINTDYQKENKCMDVKGNYHVAIVKFVQGYNVSKEYAFALFNSDTDVIVVGDNVLCDTSQGYNVGKVTKIIPQSEYSGCAVTKEIICKVDFTEFEKRKELRKEKEALKKQMDKMVKDNQELFLYQALAEKNTEMAAMLAKYRELGDI